MVAPNNEPVNLMLHAWAGRLPGMTIRANKMLVSILAGSIFLIAGLAGWITTLFTGDQAHFFLAFPVGTWLACASLWVVYQVASRPVRILEPGPNGDYELTFARWWKRAEHSFKEADTLDENGQRVFWLHRMPDGSLAPLKVHSSKVKQPRKDPITSAQIAGIKGYTDSGRAYAFKKRFTKQEQIKMGLMIGGIALLLLGMFLMTGRLLRDPLDTPSAPTSVSAASAGNVQLQTR